MIAGLIAFAVVSAVLLWIYACGRLLETARTRLAAAVFFGGLLAICVLFGAVAQHKTSDAPCVKWETTMQFNPATKTMMPMRHCVQHGEWVEND